MKVKSFWPYFVIFCFCLSTTSCVVTKHGHKPPPPPPHHHKMPPGHAKKAHGEKSAKYYAPGHHKK